MSNSAGGNSTNAAKNLLNQAQGFAGPSSDLYKGFQSSLGGAQTRQAQDYGTSTGTINNLNSYSQTGGYDPTQLTGLNNQTAGMTASGGYDPSQLNQINAGYSDLATTGGFTPAQAEAFVRQGSEGVTATGQALEDQAKRVGAATGGLGTTGALAQMARQLGQTQAQSTLNSQVGLNQLQTQNKLAGLGGEAGVASDVAGKRLTAQGQQLGLASDVAGKKLSGTEAAGNLSNQLFNTDTGQITSAGQQMLQTIGLDFNTQEEAIQALTQLSKNPGKFQTALGDLISAGGAAAGAYKAVS